MNTPRSRLELAFAAIATLAANTLYLAESDYVKPVANDPCKPLSIAARGSVRARRPGHGYRGGLGRRHVGSRRSRTASVSIAST